MSIAITAKTTRVSSRLRRGQRRVFRGTPLSVPVDQKLNGDPKSGEVLLGVLVGHRT